MILMFMTLLARCAMALVRMTMRKHYISFSKNSVERDTFLYWIMFGTEILKSGTS
jgi:hypothetical protein